MHQQFIEKVVVSLEAYRERQINQSRESPEEAQPTATATAIERLAYHLLMAVRAAKELS